MRNIKSFDPTPKCFLFARFLAIVYPIKSKSLRRESSAIKAVSFFFIGPRYTWGPIFGYESLKLANKLMFVNFVRGCS